MNEFAKRWIKVWDLPTRIFHWALVFFVLSAYLTSTGRPYGILFLLHVASGYAIILLLIFRLAWGFIGGEHARFAGFLRSWAVVKAHARGLLRLHGMRSAGHNAIGGWMILLLLTTLVLIVVTGLLTQDKTGGIGPLTGILPTSLMGPVGALHQLLGSFILYLAGLHIAGVLVESVLLRENLVRAMVDGRKPVEALEPGDWAGGAAAEHKVPAADAKEAPWWRAAVLVVLLALLAGSMAAITYVPATRPPLARIQTGNK